MWVVVWVVVFLRYSGGLPVGSVDDRVLAKVTDRALVLQQVGSFGRTDWVYSLPVSSITTTRLEWIYDERPDGHIERWLKRYPPGRGDGKHVLVVRADFEGVACEMGLLGRRDRLVALQKGIAASRSPRALASPA
jgi:hypothetical protein